MSPMCQYSAVDGYVNEWHLVHQGSRAAGGTALIMTEATAVSPEGRITPGDLGLWSVAHMDGFMRLVETVHKLGALAGIQLAHAGRKASCAAPWEGGHQLELNHGGWETLAPGDLPFKKDNRKPRALNNEDIKRIISYFAHAAVRAVECGYDIIEIHAAHGYLLHEFLSPISNNRTDEYGGSFENRIRMLVEVVRAVRKVIPHEMPLFTRISAHEWVDGPQFGLEEAVQLAAILKVEGVDLIDCSSGGNVSDAKVPNVPGYQVPFAEAVRKTGIMTGAVGLITSASQAEQILQDQKADLIFLGRELLRNPYFGLHAAHELNESVDWPVQYLRGKQ